jgi:hypothetical protein
MQNHVIIPAAPQRASKRIIATTTIAITGRLVLATMLEEEDALVAALAESSDAVPVFVLLPLFVPLAAPFQPVIVAEAGTNRTCAVAVPS